MGNNVPVTHSCTRESAPSCCGARRRTCSQNCPRSSLWTCHASFRNASARATRALPPASRLLSQLRPPRSRCRYATLALQAQAPARCAHCCSNGCFAFIRPWCEHIMSILARGGRSVHRARSRMEQTITMIHQMVMLQTTTGHLASFSRCVSSYANSAFSGTRVARTTRKSFVPMRMLRVKGVLCTDTNACCLRNTERLLTLSRKYSTAQSGGCRGARRCVLMEASPRALARREQHDSIATPRCRPRLAWHRCFGLTLPPDRSHCCCSRHALVGLA